jgi:hypothetical protein
MSCMYNNAEYAFSELDTSGHENDREMYVLGFIRYKWICNACIGMHQIQVKMQCISVFIICVRPNSARTSKKGTKLHFKSPTAERRHVFVRRSWRGSNPRLPPRRSRACAPFANVPVYVCIHSLATTLWGIDA